MRAVASWMVGVRTGFVRACLVTGVSMVVPALWAAAVALGLWWGWGGWVPGLVWAGLGTVLLTRPVSRRFRALVARWTGTVIPPGYREVGPVTRMSTGYWWNGHSYAKSEREAREDQERRLRWADPANWRDLRFVAIVSFTAGLVAAVPPAGVVGAVLAFAGSAPLLGIVSLLLAAVSAPYAWRLTPPIASRFLAPTRAMALADRVEELTAQRADTTVAQAAEIRRIERDLHDGAQARLVALGLSLATAEKLMDTDPDQARALLREARGGAATSLSELRELVRGIAPPVLTERGLVDAVRALALDSPLDTAVHADLAGRLDAPIEAAVYFGIAELLTNAAKHAHANQARVSLTRHGDGLLVEVEDDGQGGAGVRPGGGLAGLRRRLAAFDGTLEITSPAGGPTRARMLLSCESS